MNIRKSVGIAIFSLCAVQVHAEDASKMPADKLSELRKASKVVLQTERKGRGLSVDESRELLALLGTLRGELRALLGPEIKFGGSEPSARGKRGWEEASDQLAILSIELWYGEKEALRYKSRARARASIEEIRDFLQSHENGLLSSIGIGTAVSPAKARKAQKVRALLNELLQELDIESEFPPEKIQAWISRLDPDFPKSQRISHTPTLQIFEPRVRAGE